jgi:Zn-dependent protease with chaperone function
MTTVPDRARVRFPGISSRAYEHPADRTALVALRSLTGFDRVLRAVAGAFQERSLRLLFLASAVRVGERQFRNLHHMVLDAAQTLDLATPPEVFVVQNPRVSARTLGIDRPFLVVSTGALDLMDDEELRFIVGHEIGHVLSGHAVYQTMLFNLTRLAASISWIPVGGWTLRGIVVALQEWARKSELSCDRAGLLVGQDLDAALRALMKTAGGARLREMDVEAFLQQAEEYDAAGDVREGALKILSLQGRWQPFAVLRAAELRSWGRSRDYERILSGAYPRRADDPDASVYDGMRDTARSYRDSVSESADPLMRLMKDLGGNAAEAASTLRDRLTRRD